MYHFRFSLLTCLCLAIPLQAQELDGFAEPYRQIEIAAAEMGTLAKVSVQEGDRVKAGQLLASLNDEVLVASLKMAQEAMAAEGKLKSATAELKLQQTRYEKMLGLRERRHASQAEVDRAATQLEIAQAQFEAVQEELTVKKLEYQRILAQLEQRRIKSPIDGIVTRVTKDQGEFVSPTDPVVATVVQLDPLLVVFSVPKELTRQLRKDEEIRINFDRTAALGVIEFISPTSDAQSGTTRVKVRVPNPKLALQGGDACTLVLDMGEVSDASNVAGARPPAPGTTKPVGLLAPTP